MAIKIDVNAITPGLKTMIEEYRRSMRPEMGVKVSSFRDQFMIDGGGCATPIGAINFASGAKIHIFAGPPPEPGTITISPLVLESDSHEDCEKDDPLDYFNPPEPPKSTALPAISGLLTTADGDHRLGRWNR